MPIQYTPLEVTWPGKFDSQGVRSAFEVAEPVELAWREVGGEDSSDVLTSRVSDFSLIHGENMAISGTLVRDYGEACRLIYCDPPFNSGREYTDSETGEVAYGDRWGGGPESFAHFLWQRLMLAKRLLTNDGSIFLHGTDHELPLLRALMDDVFGAKNFLNQIIWHYTGGGRARSRFSNKYDVVLWYRVGATHVFNADAIRVPYAPKSGYAKGGIRAKSGKHYAPNPLGTIPDDVWDIPMVNPMSGERTTYPTQKPVALLERMVAAASMEGDLVGDVFCGSGTTLVAAQKLGRRGLGVDQSQRAIETAARRIGATGWMCAVGS